MVTVKKLNTDLAQFTCCVTFYKKHYTSMGSITIPWSYLFIYSLFNDAFSESKTIQRLMKVDMSVIE
jgi:hypothetical protein